MASLSEILQTATEKEYAAVGEFVCACSTIEITMHALLRMKADINDDIARLFIGEPRIGDLTALLRDVANLRRIDDGVRAILENSLLWAQYLNRIRSVVAHKPLYMSEGRMYFHNAVTAKHRAKSWVYDCDARELKMCSRFATDVTSNFMGIAYPDSVKTDLPSYEKSKASLQKFGLPIDPGTKHDPKPQLRPHQPRPSPA